MPALRSGDAWAYSKSQTFAVRLTAPASNYYMLAAGNHAVVAAIFSIAARFFELAWGVQMYIDESYVQKFQKPTTRTYL